jgi:hypothetical protein
MLDFELSVSVIPEVGQSQLSRLVPLDLNCIGEPYYQTKKNDTGCSYELKD